LFINKNIMTKENVKIKQFVDADGNAYKTVTVYGAEIDDVLDGLQFDVDIKPDGDIDIHPTQLSIEYFSTLNRDKWLGRVREHVYATGLAYSADNNGGKTALSAEYMDDVAVVQSQPDKASRLSRILGEMRQVGESDAPDAQAAFDSMSADQKIAHLFEKTMAHAKSKDPDDIIITYLDDLYNPETTTLDKGNLLFNLTLIARLQELDIIDFDFDESVNNAKGSASEYTLAHEFWDEIMTSDMDTESKYSKILDKNFRLLFYSALFQEMATNSSKTAYSNTKRKLAILFSDDNASIPTMEEGVVKYIKDKSEDGSIIMITPDLTPFFEIDVASEEALSANDEEAQIKYLGIWNRRKIYEINTKQIKGLKDFDRGAFFIKKGNRYIINPTKPLAYYNVIDNPFLEKPSLKMYVNLDTKFTLMSSTFLRVTTPM
jgi:hypothetical protein